MFGDDFYALLSGLCRAPERFESFTRTVHDLLVRDSHGLGVQAPPALSLPAAQRLARAAAWLHDRVVAA